jgi:hypothetical protein
MNGRASSNVSSNEQPKPLRRNTRAIVRIPEEGILHSRRRENFKSYVSESVYHTSRGDSEYDIKQSPLIQRALFPVVEKLWIFQMHIRGKQIKVLTISMKMNITREPNSCVATR